MNWYSAAACSWPNPLDTTSRSTPPTMATSSAVSTSRRRCSTCHREQRHEDDSAYEDLDRRGIPPRDTRMLVILETVAEIDSVGLAYGLPRQARRLGCRSR